jgi:Repeat of unknown function (DUF5907)
LATSAKLPPKILRVLGPKTEASWERALVGIYDAIDALGSVTLSLATSPTTIVAGSGATTGSLRGPPGPRGRESDQRPVRFIPMRGGGGGITQLVGDVLAGPGTGSQTATLANIPAATPAQGSILFTSVAAPTSPSTGIGAVYVDSTSLNLAVKNASGVVNHGVRTKAATTSQFLTAIADNGTVSAAQPAFTDISGSVTLSQLGNGAALSVLGNPNSTSGTRSDIAAGSGSDFPLRERSGVLGFGTLATAAYGNSSVTYAKLQSTAAGKVMLGRDVGAGTVQEIGIDSSLAMTGAILGVQEWRQFSMTWGGAMPGVYSSLPAFLGIGDQAYSSTTTLGFRAPVATNSAEISYQVAANSLTGTGSINLNLYKNGVSQGTLANIALGSSGGTVVASGVAFAAGDLISMQLAATGGSPSGGSITIYIVGRFHT